MLTRRAFTAALTASPALLATPGDPFPIRRGTNISHWLSQSKQRGEARRTYFQRSDVAFLAAAGLDHLRIPVDEEQLFLENGKPDAEAFALLKNALDWCDEFSLRAILDLHILRSHHFNAKEKPLWTQPTAQDRFIECWRLIPANIGKRSNTKVAYELMNEPVADDPEKWNVLIARATSAIRETDPKRKVVIGSNMWQSVDTFDVLRIPANDPNIILSFHYYHPMVLTHYGAGWTKVGEYKGPVTYPGRLVPEAEMQKLKPDLLKSIAPQRIVFDRSTAAAMMAKPIEFARIHKLPLYCGEWGCINKAPLEPRMRWYRDMRSIFDENNIGWATWDYKGGFGLIQNGAPLAPMFEALGLTVPPYSKQPS